ncbi:hypothetical protein PIB30_092543 [Stylosanthes scabra]|uniref:Uncharacterized protein n=1 Tax=Stylosanthes scabra TaxID=79078 RepID=A0ABU6VY18_9FABA|nr:hypothetical protein [Stylosanthes scabra]
MQSNYLRSGEAIDEFNNKTISYPKEEDAEVCMQIDVIEELIMEVQEEEAMQKFQAKQARKNEESMLQQKDEQVQEKEAMVQKNQKTDPKPLPTTLKYAFLGNAISSSLYTKQKEVRRLWDPGK